MRVKPRLMDVLLRLAAAPGEVVPRDTLLADVWPRRMVNDDVLSRVIADLRVALRDDAREARFIETIPKVGYRLIAPVIPASAPPAQTVAGIRSPRLRMWQVAGALVAAVAFTLTLVLRPAAPVPTERAQLEGQLARAEPFSSDVALEVGPRFSPDGRHVAFAAGQGQRSQIVIRDVATAQRRTFGDPGDLNLSPVFFPDGERIAFYRRTPDGECAIVALDLRTLAALPLVDCARQPRPRFDLSPDGKRLVYVATLRPGFPAGLVVRNLDRGDERTLTTPEPEMGDDLHPRFAPDGAQIVFFRGTQSHREIWMVDADDPASVRNTQSPRGLAYGAAWLGAQGPLLVAADWFGQRSLNLFDPVTRSAAAVGARGARFPDVDAARQHRLRERRVLGQPLPPRSAGAVAKSRANCGRRRATRTSRSIRRTAGACCSSPTATARPASSSRPSMGRRPGFRCPTTSSTCDPTGRSTARAIYAIRASRREDGGRVQQGIRIKVPAGSVDVLSAFGDAVFDVREGDASGRVDRGRDRRQCGAPAAHADCSARRSRAPAVADRERVSGGRRSARVPAASAFRAHAVRTRHARLRATAHRRSTTRTGSTGCSPATRSGIAREPPPPRSSATTSRAAPSPGAAVSRRRRSDSRSPCAPTATRCWSRAKGTLRSISCSRRARRADRTFRFLRRSNRMVNIGGCASLPRSNPQRPSGPGPGRRAPPATRRARRPRSSRRPRRNSRGTA